MKTEKIILAGGDGYLGRVLARFYASAGAEVVVLTRKAKAAKGQIRKVWWDGRSAGDWVNELENATLLVNLCGKNVNCRYTNKNKTEILQSRLVPTALLNAVLSSLKNPPPCWINISSATIYRYAEDRAQDDTTGEIGYGFSIDVCKAWESTFFQQPIPGVRKIALRLGIVLGRADGAFPRLLNLTRLGLGGKIGTGRQMISWIHEQDTARAIDWISRHPEMEGTINCTAPKPVQQSEFMRVVRNTVGLPFGLPCPAWLLEIGAWLIGTETELLLKSRWVLPEKLLQSGFNFQYPTVESAQADLLALRQ
ncbi:TIGR01777 family oxidoreductase [Flavihumibacter sp. CACIAM 22H1]|uniref:TIGR01777 family oxidoreductase n=1 Tax=Flavihumibacter sp. CACIAM 22H1 TaxID=1812911 RepID=UPI0007A91E6F|nr:TIGR01777 family oxidoreductase [Flavihumibacter sp. CACIAM 22H1]KYP13186.1 MAG: epimerase [Flavihumibacter sp. CACIAM 22H1]